MKESPSLKVCTEESQHLNDSLQCEPLQSSDSEDDISVIKIDDCNIVDSVCNANPVLTAENEQNHKIEKSPPGIYIISA